MSFLFFFSFFLPLRLRKGPSKRQRTAQKGERLQFRFPCPFTELFLSFFKNKIWACYLVLPSFPFFFLLLLLSKTSFPYLAGMFFFFPVLGIKKNQIEKKNRKKRVDLFEAAVHELQLFARETGGFAEGVQAVGTVARQRHVALLARLAAA